MPDHPRSRVLSPPTPGLPPPAQTRRQRPGVGGATRSLRPISRKRRRLVYNPLALVAIALSAFPVYWMVSTSFRPEIEIRSEVQFLPFGGTLDNYRNVFDQDYFLDNFLVSLKVTTLTVVIAVFSAFLAAVAVARFRFRGRLAFLVTILVVQMVPSEALMISLNRVLDGWDLRNSITGLTLAYVAFVLPFTVWTLRGFVEGVPPELEEAAMVDGSSRLRAFFTITLPLIAPGLVATGIFGVIQAWNEYTLALVIMDRPEMETLPLWLQSFNHGARGTEWGAVMAGSTLISLPVVVFFMFVQRRVVAGLTAGAVKG
jgi:N,N'-diacetylchitobiose transport system permease protein